MARLPAERGVEPDGVLTLPAWRPARHRGTIVGTVQVGFGPVTSSRLLDKLSLDKVADAMLRLDHDQRSLEMAKRAFAAFILLLGSPAVAQIGGNGVDGVFHPSSNVVLDTTARPGGWDFSSVTIPAGVTVQLIGTNPAILRSIGPVQIDGHLSADALAPVGTVGGAPGAGGFAGGDVGNPGAGPAGGVVGSYSPFASSPGGPGGHATPGRQSWAGGSTGVYGDDWVFDLRGGSGEGASVWPLSWGYPWGAPGGGGGGVVVVLSDSAIQLGGRVSARGHQFGAAGGIFLRALGAVALGPGATIDAAGFVHPFTGRAAGDGFVRLDGYGGKPVIDPSATIAPFPLNLSLPAIRHAGPMQVGTTYTVAGATLPGDGVWFLVSAGTVSIPLPPLGILELDPSLTLVLGMAVANNLAPDPQATLSLAIPNDPGLVGLPLWLQAINASTLAAAGPRLSNTLSTPIQ